MTIDEQSEVSGMNLFGELPTRPKRSQIDKSEAFITIGKQVFDWCNGETAMDQICGDIEKACRYSYSMDGFDLAKQMDSQGYTADSELVEIMDGLSSEIRYCHKKAIEKWVKANNITPKLSVGDEVTLPASVIHEDRDMKGEIVGISENRAQYTIRIPELGHVKKGENGIQGRVLDYEKLHPLEPELTQIAK